MPGFAYLFSPGQEERRQWFPVAGRVPEPLLAHGGRLVPWRVITRYQPDRGVPAGVGVGLPASAGGLASWPDRPRRKYLLRLLAGLAEADALLVGFRADLGEGPGAAAVRTALRTASREIGTPVPIEGWAGRLAGCLAATELAALARGWDTERIEVAVVGGESPEGRVVARMVARQYGRLVLAGEAPALGRLAGQILHETGTAARVSADWPRTLRRAELVILAAPLPPGANSMLRPSTLVLAAGTGTGGASAGFAWPAAGAAPVAADLAAVATVAGHETHGSGGELLPLVQAEEATVAAVTELRRAMDCLGVLPVRLLDKGGKLNL